MKNIEMVKFDDGVLSSVFFHELRWLCANIKRHANNLFESCTVPDEGCIIQVDPVMHSVISSILVDAANIKKLSVTAGGKLHGESAERHRMRVSRARAIEDFLKDIGLVEMYKVKVRNTLEHFDEYLDESNLALTKKPKGTMAAYNMIISHWEGTNPRLYPIRLYVSSERKFYNMKWVVDIGALADEASAILNKFSTERKLGDGDQGGLMIRV